MILNKDIILGSIIKEIICLFTLLLLVVIDVEIKNLFIFYSNFEIIHTHYFIIHDFLHDEDDEEIFQNY